MFLSFFPVSEALYFLVLFIVDFFPLCSMTLVSSDTFSSALLLLFDYFSQETYSLEGSNGFLTVTHNAVLRKTGPSPLALSASSNQLVSPCESILDQRTNEEVSS